MKNEKLRNKKSRKKDQVDEVEEVLEGEDDDVAELEGEDDEAELPLLVFISGSTAFSFSVSIDALLGSDETAGPDCCAVVKAFLEVSLPSSLFPNEASPYPGRLEDTTSMLDLWRPFPYL